MDHFEPTTDHDLLITLLSEMKGMRKDVQELGDGMSAKVNDHENRIRALEKTIEGFGNVPECIEKQNSRLSVVEKLTDNLMLKMVFGTAVVSLIFTFIGALVLAYIKKQIGL